MDMKLGKQHAQGVGGMETGQVGKPIVVTADGDISEKEFKDKDAAVAEARRLARKTDDDVYVYIPVTKVGPSEPKVEEVAL